MDAVEQFPCEGATAVVFATDQPQYQPLPALRFADSSVLTEWCFTEAERASIARGENLRLWIWLYPQRCECCGTVHPTRLQPVALEITDERKG